MTLTEGRLFPGQVARAPGALIDARRRDRTAAMLIPDQVLAGRFEREYRVHCARLNQNSWESMARPEGFEPPTI